MRLEPMITGPRRSTAQLHSIDRALGLLHQGLNPSHLLYRCSNPGLATQPISKLSLRDGTQGMGPSFSSPLPFSPHRFCHWHWWSQDRQPQPPPLQKTWRWMCSLMPAEARLDLCTGHLLNSLAIQLHSQDNMGRLTDQWNKIKNTKRPTQVFTVDLSKMQKQLNSARQLNIHKQQQQKIKIKPLT